MSFDIIIPARYQSSRLPGKPLRLLAGKPLLQHVYECAQRTAARNIIIATDDDRIATVAQTFAAKVCMTATSHASGTQRIAEVIDQYQIAEDTIVVNLQGDEPLMPAACITQVAALLEKQADAQVATLSAPLHEESELANPNIVKVVSNKLGYALYFSRAMIPYQRDYDAQLLTRALQQGVYQRHIGLYAYRAGYIKEYIQQQPSCYEQLENLEQLRVLWHGGTIAIAEAHVIPGPGVDTEEELRVVEALLRSRH